MEEEPAACSRPEVVRAGHRGDRTTLETGTRSDDPAVRAAALTGLARAGLVGRDHLSAGAADPSPAVRRRAAGILGRPAGAGLDPDAALLLPLLDDPDGEVADWACWAAGERPDATEVLVGPLVRLATTHDDALVREAAVAALGSLGDPRGRDAVLTATEDVATVRRRAVLALVAFDGNDVDDALRRLAADRDWQVRQAAEELAPDDEPVDDEVDPTT